MSLAKAESRRLGKRRMTKWMLPIGIGLLLLIIGAVFLNTSKPTPAARAAAEVKAEAMYQQQVAEWERWKGECEKGMSEQAKAEGACQGPKREHFQAEQFMPEQFPFKEAYGPMLIGWAAIMAMVAFLLGASFIGAEWRSGAMMNLLTWRPKRTEVLATKLGVFLGWTAAIGAATWAMWTGLLYMTGELRGNTDGMTSGVWQSFALSGLRGLGMIILFGALGFALAAIGRHTALALGVALGAILVGQVGLGIVFGFVNPPFPEQYFLPVHMYAWMNKEMVLEDYSQQVCGANGCDEPAKMVISYGETGLMAAAVVAVVLVIAFWQMKRRDVS